MDPHISWNMHQETRKSDKKHKRVPDICVYRRERVLKAHEWSQTHRENVKGLTKRQLILLEFCWVCVGEEGSRGERGWRRGLSDCTRVSHQLSLWKFDRGEEGGSKRLNEGEKSIDFYKLYLCLMLLHLYVHIIYIICVPLLCVIMWMDLWHEVSLVISFIMAVTDIKWI